MDDDDRDDGWEYTDELNRQQEEAMQDERFAALMADMVKARAALGNVTKNKKANAGSHSYAYSDLAAVTATVSEALDTSGAALWFTQNVTTTDQSVTVVSAVFHANGSHYEGAPMTLPVLKRDPQGFGSAISYARRYSMLAFWGIAAEDDDGKSAGDGPPPRQNARQDAPPDAHRAIRDVADACIALHAAAVTAFDKDNTDTSGFWELHRTANKVQGEDRNVLWEMLARHSAVRAAIKEYAGYARAEQAKVPA